VLVQNTQESRVLLLVCHQNRAEIKSSFRWAGPLIEIAYRSDKCEEISAAGFSLFRVRTSYLVVEFISNVFFLKI